jgi:hypothetical protein
VSEPGGTFRVETPTGSVAAPVGELRDAWVQALPEIMDTPSTSGA